jgi:hypothetical protein
MGELAVDRRLEVSGDHGAAVLGALAAPDGQFVARQVQVLDAQCAAFE